MKSAKELREQIESKVLKAASEEIKHIEELFLESNGFSIHLTVLSDKAKEILEASGYKVKYNQGDIRDHEDSSSYTISI